MKGNILFWDVDTQFDFMRPAGSLYVPGAEEIIERVSEVRRFAFERGYSMVASADWHVKSDAEISDKPDLKETFPAHCMAGTEGAARVGFLGGIPAEYIKLESMDEEALRKMLSREQFHVVIKKTEFDVFSNPNTEKLLALAAPERVIVFGVALDVCVCHAVSGMLKRGRAKITVLKDAVKGLGLRPAGEIFTEFENRGAAVMAFGEIKGEL